MSYTGYGAQVSSIEAGTWYELRRLRHAVRALRGLNFMIQEQRNQALARLAQMAEDAPFAVDARFPLASLWVCEEFGDWSRKFQQLRTALLVKDMSKDDKVRDGQGRSSDLSDNVVAYANALTAISDQLTRLDGVFSRETFEGHYDLIWVP